jgi:hypothetical protein
MAVPKSVRPGKPRTGGVLRSVITKSRPYRKYERVVEFTTLMG